MNGDDAADTTMDESVADVDDGMKSAIEQVKGIGFDAKHVNG
jgi:uncharacterized protein (UPF0335 family)